MAAVNERERQVREAEAARCKALLSNDTDTLRQLLSPDLTHTHTNGKMEDYELYLALLVGPMTYLAMERHDLTVRLYGSTAVMDGLANVSGRIGDGDVMTMVVRMLQVWVEGDDGWRMVAFQGTRVT